MPPRRAPRRTRDDDLHRDDGARAARTGAINLGQGFPDTDGPTEVIEAAVAALRGGENQYAPLGGVPSRCARRCCEHQRACYGLEPEDVLVTFGATEAIAAALLALCDPGDEVVVLEPYYDSYAACIAFAGARRQPVTLRPPGVRARPRRAAARRPARAHGAAAQLAAQPDRPRARRAELEAIAEVCIEHDLICISDEVYEHLVYDGEHIPLATLARDGGADADDLQRRQVVLLHRLEDRLVLGSRRSSSPPSRTVKQYLTFAGGTPLQHAAAAALRLPPAHLEALRDDLRAQARPALCRAQPRPGYAR